MTGEAVGIYKRSGVKKAVESKLHRVTKEYRLFVQENSTVLTHKIILFAKEWGNENS